jgi:hypothetical protein
VVSSPGMWEAAIKSKKILSNVISQVPVSLLSTFENFCMLLLPYVQ